MEYAILRVIWWVLVAVLMIGLMIMDGHDMGVGTLSPFVGKTDSERRAAINSVAPHWMVIKFGLLLVVERCLLHGHWCMRLHSQCCISQF